MTSYRLAILTLSLAMSHATFAQSDDDASMPNTMLAFLKPGMRVGVQSVDGTAGVVLSVYADDQYNVAQDLAALGRTSGDVAALADKHPVIRKQLDAYVNKLTQKYPDAKPEKIRIVPLFRTSLGTVRGVGDDFVLIELEGEAKRRRILSKRSIGHIDLDGNPVRFLDSSAVRR